MALYLLIVGWARFYGWAWFPPEINGAVSKGLGGLLTLGLLPLVYRAAPSRAVLLVLLWFAFESLQIALCSFAWAIAPWYVPEGGAICSSRIGFDLGAVGILLVAAILWRIGQPVRSDRSGEGPGSPQ